jgi:hypothetical protein
MRILLWLVHCIDATMELISHGTVFFSHNKTTSVVLSAAEIISQTAPYVHNEQIK